MMTVEVGTTKSEGELKLIGVCNVLLNLIKDKNMLNCNSITKRERSIRICHCRWPASVIVYMKDFLTNWL